MKAVVHGGPVCAFRTLHISLVLKFFLHLSQTARRESGNLTFRDCLKPGGVKVKTFYQEEKPHVEKRSGKYDFLVAFYLPRVMLPVGTSFADGKDEVGENVRGKRFVLKAELQTNIEKCRNKKRNCTG